MEKLAVEESFRLQGGELKLHSSQNCTEDKARTLKSTANQLKVDLYFEGGPPICVDSIQHNVRGKVFGVALKVLYEISAPGGN